MDLVTKKKRVITNYLLDEAGVDHISAELQDWMTREKVQAKNVLRCRLAMESILESLCIHYDRKLNVSVEMGRKGIGGRAFVLRYGNEPFNPTEESGENESYEWANQILSNIGLMPVWSFRRGTNELTLKLPRNKLSSEAWLVTAFLGAVLLGFLQPAIPQTVTAFVGEFVLNSLADIFMNLLGTFAGLVIFLSVINGICGAGGAAEFNKRGKYLIVRNLGMTFLGAAFCAVCMIPFFHFQAGAAGGESQFAAVLELVLQIVPGDPVSPFLNGNTLQIVFMSILVGTVIIALDTKADKVRELAVQANSVVMEVIEIICKLLPLYIFASLTALFWENGIATFKSIWKPIVLCALFCGVMMVFKMLLVAIRCRVSFPKLFRKIFPGFLIGLTTASSPAAYGVVMEENDRELGIDAQLSSFGFPIEMILSNSTMAGGFLAIVYFLAEYDGTVVNPMWFVTTGILITILTFSMPPVSGGPLICLGILLAQCNISPSCLGIAGTLVLVCDFFMTGTRVVICQMELVLEARHWQTLDHEKLRA